MHGEMQGKYYRYCSRSIRYSTDLNSENNKFDMETFDLVSEYRYCMKAEEVDDATPKMLTRISKWQKGWS